ncbi:MAG: phospholipase D-like domain-containing protein [Rhodoferax sp.]
MTEGIIHWLGLFGHRTGALHMKSATLDHKQVFLGSMNFDQRSAVLTTELGLIMDSPAEPPETTAWQRFMLHLLSPLVSEKQL